MRRPVALCTLLLAWVFAGVTSLAGADVVPNTPATRLVLQSATLPPLLWQLAAILVGLTAVVLLVWNLLLRGRMECADSIRTLRRSPGSPDRSSRSFSSQMEEDLVAAVHAAELATGTVEELCEKCVDSLRDILGLAALVLYVHDLEQQELVRTASAGVPLGLQQETNPESASESTMAFLRQAVHIASPDQITDVSSGSRAPELAQAVRAAGMKVVHVFPLISGRIVPGVALACADSSEGTGACRAHGFDVLANELGHAIRVKDIEHRLRFERQRLNDVLRAMGDSVMIVDRRLRIIWSSDMGDEKLQGAKGEQCHRHYHDYEEACPECAVVRTISSGRLEIGEVHITTGRNEKRWYQVTAAPLKKDSRGVHQVLVLSHDVTDKRLLEQQLIWSDKLSSVGELVAGVAHELNNPLAAVLGFSELMLTGEVPDKIREDLTRIHQEAARCRKVVQNLLTFARRTPFEKELVSINDLLDNALELKSYQLRVDNISVHKELSKALPTTMADGQQLQQVFVNLLNNAHDAIRGHREPGTIAVRTCQRNGRIVVQVADTGPGIPANDLRRIFDPFFTTKPRGKGTGLGLSLAYGIIKAHDGDIHVESIRGEGTTFTVELPIERREEETEAAEAEVAETVPEPRKLDVLVVDDEPTMVELISSLLVLDGHRVRTTSDGREALSLVEDPAGRFDLIITDVKMPGVSGEELYHRVQELRPEFAGNIIFTTGDTASAETRELLKLTGNTVLEKPFRMEDLRHVIDEAVGSVG